MNCSRVALRLNAMTRFMMVASFAAAALSPWALALAQEHFGIVTKIYTGDRVELSTAYGTFQVQLAQIEAPSPKEPIGVESQLSLAQICYRTPATLLQTGAALDGSTIGALTCGGARAAEEQVRRGYARVKPPLDRRNEFLRSAQNSAQAAGRGIWARAAK